MAAPINAQILQSLQSFTQSLRQENVRLDEEERKDRVRTSASRISEAFSTLQPGHDEEDARQLMLDVIGDAADLEALDANLPLIQGLYSDSLNAIRTFKEKKQDKYLQDYVTAQDPDDKIPDEMLGVNQMKLLQHQQSREFDVEHTDTEGIVTHKIYEADGTLRTEVPVDDRTDEQRLGYDIRKSIATSRATNSFMVPSNVLDKDGNIVSFDKRTGISYSQIVGDDGRVMLIPTGGEMQTGLGRQLSLDEGRYLKDQIKNQETIGKRGYAAASLNAETLAGILGMNILGDDQKKASIKKIRGMMSEFAFAKTQEELVETELYKQMQNLSEPQKQAARQEISNFLINQQSFENANREMRESQVTIDYMDMKKNEGLSDEDYKSGFNTVESYITDGTPAGWGAWIRKRVAQLYNHAKGLTGEKAIDNIVDIDEAVEIWRNLDLKYKGILIKELKEKRK